MMLLFQLFLHRTQNCYIKNNVVLLNVCYVIFCIALYLFVSNKEICIIVCMLYFLPTNVYSYTSY